MRAIAHDAHRQAALRGFGLERARHAIRAHRQRAGVAGYVDERAHGMPHCFAISPKLSGVTRPCSSPFTINDGASAQFPRQYTGSSVTRPSAEVSPKFSRSFPRTNSSSAREFIDWQASARHIWTTYLPGAVSRK